jgi:SsrA-binding protein
MAKQTQKNKPVTKPAQPEAAHKTIAVNRQAYHDYFVEKTFEAGISLVGTEIKSIRLGHANLRTSYALIRQGEIWLENAHIAVYEQGNQFNHEPTRRRKLLMHRKEIILLEKQVATKGLTLIPLKLYLKGGKAKIEVGLCKGKKLFDKREALKERDTKREIEQIVRGR